MKTKKFIFSIVVALLGAALFFQERTMPDPSTLTKIVGVVICIIGLSNAEEAAG